MPHSQPQLSPSPNLGEGRGGGGTDAYTAALQLVAQLEAYLAYGRPLCTKSGRRLVDLEDAVQAILKDQLEFPLSIDKRRTS